VGVRVPTVIVSPLIPKGLIDPTIYDHTSVLATMESIFGLQPLTERDTHAQTLDHLFSLATPRTDAPTTLPAPAQSGIRCPGDPGASAASTLLVTPDAALTAEPVPSSLQGFLHVAFLRDVQASPLEEHASRTARYLRIQTHLEAHHYLEEVRQKVEPPEAQ
jgi:phospholipase C